MGDGVEHFLSRDSGARRIITSCLTLALCIGIDALRAAGARVDALDHARVIGSWDAPNRSLAT